MEEELQKEMEELKKLGYRIKSKSIRYIYNKGRTIGKKVFFEVERKELLINSDENTKGKSI